MDSCGELLHFNSNNGYVKINQDGLYFLYAQVNKQHTYFCQIRYITLDNPISIDNNSVVSIILVPLRAAFTY